MSVLAHTATRTLRCGDTFSRSPRRALASAGRPPRPLAKPTKALKSLRDKWQRSGAFNGGSVEAASAIPSADWQAGVTDFNWRFKVLLDGEPIAGAVAARESADDVEGWVVVQLFRNILDGNRVCGTERRKGLVRIVPGDRD